MTFSSNKSKRHLFITFAKYVLILLMVVYVFIWIASPFVVRHIAEPPLHLLGVSLSENSSVRFNPFTSTLTISDFVLYDQQKRQTLLVEQAEVSIYAHRLLFNELYVTEFLLVGSNIKVVKDNQRHPRAGVVARALAAREADAVVGVEHDDGIVEQPGVFEAPDGHADTGAQSLAVDPHGETSGARLNLKL